VIAPKRVATQVWPEELPKWGASNRAGFQVQMLNYEMIHRIDTLAGYTGIVLDELTRLKDPSGKRFKMLEKLLKDSDVRYRWGLTGSFTSNGLEDTFGQCKIVDQKLLGRSKGAFLQQYFYCVNRDFGQWEPIPGALEQVMEKIKPATYVLENASYANTLPPLHVVPVELELADYKQYNKMRNDYVAEFGGQKVSALSAATASQKLSQLASGFVYDTAHTPAAKAGKFNTTRTAMETSRHKLERLQAILEENQRANTIIVYNYEEERDAILRAHPKAVLVTDDGAIGRWNDGLVENLLVHPKSAGHGLNLQAGGNVIVFYSLPWSLELYEQTIGRLHRGGQTKPVWVYCLITKGTIEERVWQALQDKRNISEAALEELK
jgi:hypothetical protein